MEICRHATRVLRETVLQVCTFQHNQRWIIYHRYSSPYILPLTADLLIYVGQITHGSCVMRDNHAECVISARYVMLISFS